MLLANGYTPSKIIPIADLPERIGYTRDAVSLIADPSDIYRDQVALYLVNDTNTPLANVIGEGSRPITQVRVGGFWIRDHLDVLECASFGPSRDLPPRHALAMGTWNELTGESQCQRRFFFQMNGGRIASQPIPGTYRLQDLSESLKYDQARDLDSIADESLNSGQWSESYCPGNIEEFVAILELARNEGQFLSLRAKVAKWIDGKTHKSSWTGDEAKAVGPLLEVLAKPWLNCLDRQALAERARSALTAETKGGFGSPENCRAAVWHYLSTTGLDMGPEHFGSDSNPCNEATLAALVGLADQTMRESDNARELRFAGLFLSSSSVQTRHFETQHVREYLASGKQPLIHTALKILAKRRASDEAGGWLRIHVKELGEDGPECYMEVLSQFQSNGPLAEWEPPVIEHLLESFPLETLAVAETRLRKLPPGIATAKALLALRRFLKHELEPGRREWWKHAGEETQIDPFDNDAPCMIDGLTNGVCLLKTWGDASDMVLIRAYLDHPAARFYPAGRGIGKMVFGPRFAAKQILESAKLPVPKELVTEKLVVIAKPQDPKTLFPAFPRAWKFAVVGFLLGATVAGIIWWLKKQRSKQIVRPMLVFHR